MQWPSTSGPPSPARAAPAIVYAAVVLVASVVDPPTGGLALTGPLGLVGVDKWYHVVGYAGLAVLLSYALRARTARRIALAVGLAIVYGVGIEVVQSALPFRAFSLADMLANAVGAGLAGVVLWGWRRHVGRGDASTPA